MRNGGFDAGYLKFKDGWQQSLLQGLDFSVQQDRLAVLYLNGEYWGPYNLNDKYDDHYIKAHYDVSNCLMIKNAQLEEGEEEDFHYYEDLLSYASHDLSDPDEYLKFQQIMEVQSMADYFAAEIYMANTDWWDWQNTTLWRSMTVETDNQYADGRWRFIMFDTEYSSSLFRKPENSWDFDNLKRTIDSRPLFAAALQNSEFRTLFKESMYKIAYTYLTPDIVNSTLDEWAALWKPYMEIIIHVLEIRRGHGISISPTSKSFMQTALIIFFMLWKVLCPTCHWLRIMLILLIRNNKKVDSFRNSKPSK